MRNGSIILALLAVTTAGCVANRLGGTNGSGFPKGSSSLPHAGEWPKPAAIEALYPDGSPGRLVTIQAVDADERHYYVGTDELGRATLSIWTDRIPVWSQRSIEGGWDLLVPARIRKADGADGYRISVTLGPRRIQ